jgi:hypothetical protein
MQANTIAFFNMVVVGFLKMFFHYISDLNDI